MAALGSGSSGLLAGFSARDRRWVWINVFVVPALINAGSSALIAWLTLGGEHRVPVWSLPLVDHPGLVTDTLGTFVVLPFFTTIGISIAVRLAQRNGQLDSVDLPSVWTALAGRLPDQLLRRAGLMAVAVVALLGPLSIVVLASAGFGGGIDPATFVAYKAVLAVGLGAVFTPLVAVAAIAAAPRLGSVRPLSR